MLYSRSETSAFTFMRALTTQKSRLIKYLWKIRYLKNQKNHKNLYFLKRKNQPKYCNGLQKSRFQRITARGRKVSKNYEKWNQISSQILWKIETISMLEKVPERYQKKTGVLVWRHQGCSRVTHGHQIRFLLSRIVSLWWIYVLRVLSVRSETKIWARR